MTSQKSFKRIVRARMDKTGESYTAARAALLAANGDRPGAAPVLTLADETIRRRTGRGWEAWFDLLDGWGAVQRSHTEIARWLTGEHGLGGWDAQTVALNYERARGLRAVGERSSGFAASASRTVAVPVQTLFEAFVEPSLRRRWLPGGELRERTATPPKSARFDWEDGRTRVAVWFEARGEAKSTVALEHERLADGREVERMKAHWRERLAAMKDLLERDAPAPEAVSPGRGAGSAPA